MSPDRQGRADWTQGAADPAPPAPDQGKGLAYWAPGWFLSTCVGGGIALTLLWAGLVVPWYVRQRSVVVRSCSAPAAFAPPPAPDVLGLPDSAAKLGPGLSIARGVAEDSISWAAGPGAPNGVAFRAGSSALLHKGGGRLVPSDAVTSWVKVDAGTAVLTTCVDSRKTGGGLSNGTFAGFVTVPTADPAKPVTVREELAVQSTYVGDFWPLGLVIVAFALALHSDQLRKSARTVAYLAAVTGAATFCGAYYATALANPSWGGPRAIGTLLVTVFTATTGAIATVVATGARSG